MRWSFSFITHDAGSAELFWPPVLRGFPQEFAVAPAVTLGWGSLLPDRLEYASGLFNMMRNLGGAIGIAIGGTILSDRANLHFLQLAEHLSSSNPAPAPGKAASWAWLMDNPSRPARKPKTHFYKREPLCVVS